MMYKNKRNGVVAKLVSQNDKFKTVTMERQDTGEVFDVTTSTFRRWWAKAPEVDTQEQETASDGTPYAEVMADIVAGAKGKVEKAKKDKVKKDKEPASKVKKERKKTEADPEVIKVKDFILETVQGIGGELFYPEKAPNVVLFKVDGHMFARINCSKKQITLCCRSVAVEGITEPDKQINHLFDVGFVFTQVDKSSKELITKLLTACRDQQVAKKASVKSGKGGKGNG